MTQKYALLCNNGGGIDILDLGDCQDFDEADDRAVAMEVEQDFWIMNEAELHRLRKRINGILGA